MRVPEHEVDTGDFKIAAILSLVALSTIVLSFWEIFENGENGEWRKKG